MASGQKTIFVYDHFTSQLPTLLGRLFVSGIKGGELYSFPFPWPLKPLLTSA